MRAILAPSAVTALLVLWLLHAATGVLHAYPFFLLEHPGTRSRAMAGAGAALTGYADAAFYDPGGLAFLRSADAFGEVNRLPEPRSFITYWSSAAAVPLTHRVSVGAFTSGTYLPIGTTHEGWDYEIGLSVGVLPREWLGCGLNLKYIGVHWLKNGHPYVPTESSHAWAADAGLLVRPQTRLGHPTFGITVRNVGTPIHYKWEPPDTGGWAEDLPATLLVGVGWSSTARDLGLHRFPELLPTRYFPQDWLLDNWGATAAYDFRVYGANDLRHSIGVELRPLPFVAARAGWLFSGTTAEGPHFSGYAWGLGLDLKYIRFDVCEDGHRLNPRDSMSHYSFSVALNIGQPLLKEGGLFGRNAE